MSNPAVLVALRAQLQAIPGLPTMCLPNEAVSGVSVPYLLFDEGIENVTQITIDGEELFELRPQVSIMVEPGDFTNGRDAIGWPIKQAFKTGTDIMSGGTKVGYMRETPVYRGAPRPDSGLYRSDLGFRVVSFQRV